MLVILTLYSNTCYHYCQCIFKIRHAGLYLSFPSSAFTDTNTPQPLRIIRRYLRLFSDFALQFFVLFLHNLVLFFLSRSWSSPMYICTAVLLIIYQFFSSRQTRPSASFFCPPTPHLCRTCVSPDSLCSSQEWMTAMWYRRHRWAGILIGFQPILNGRIAVSSP